MIDVTFNFQDRTKNKCEHYVIYEYYVRYGAHIFNRIEK